MPNSSPIYMQPQKLLDRFPIPAVRNQKGYHWYVVGTVSVGAFMAALDASIINIAMPVLQKQFAVSMDRIEWISLIYLLTLAALIITFGRLSDMIGRRYMYAFGFLVFIISSLMCGLSENIAFLLFSRSLQAVGAAMLQANSVSIITAAAPDRDRGKAIGIQASAQGIGLSLGPAIGGAILTFFDWRWLFFINIPIGILGTLLGIMLLPRDKKSEKKESFDFWGALFLTPALVTLVFLLNTGLHHGWGSPLMIACYVITALFFIIFVNVEKRTTYPMVDLRLFRNPVLSMGIVTGILSFAVMYAILLLVPYDLDGVFKLSSFHSGLYLMIVPIGMTLFTPISGMVADQFGTKIPTVLGMISAAIGSMVLSYTGGTLNHIVWIVGLFLIGAGLGIFTPPNNSSVMGAAPSDRLGIAGGILNMARTLGMGFGITAGGLVYQVFLIHYHTNHVKLTPINQMISSFRGSFLVIGALALLAAVLSTGRTNPANKTIRKK